MPSQCKAVFLVPVTAHSGNLWPNGPKPEAKAASGWSVRGGGGGKKLDGRCPLHPGSGEGLADLQEGYSLRSVAAPSAPDLSCAEQLAGRWHCVALSVPTPFALYVCQESSSY